MKAIQLALVLGALAIVSTVFAPAASATSGTLVVTEDTVLTEDHNGYIAIAADNVTLDCAGHTVRAPDPPQQSGAIEVFGGTGVTVKRCKVVGSPVNGIYAGGASDSRYEDNVLLGNANHGMHIDSASGNAVVRNTSRGNGALGIVFTAVVDSEIRSNVVENNVNWAGIALFAESQRISVVGNTARRNAWGFLIESGSGSNTITANTAQQNLIQGFALTGTAGNVLTGNTANNNGAEGIVLFDADENQLIGNVANRNGDRESHVYAGIALVSGSSGNVVDRNTANENADVGFVVESSDINVLTRNTANANGRVGFDVRLGSSFNRLEGNTARRNAVVDAVDDLTGTGNVWSNNNFGSTSGI
jgi:parallel beta-helix repeat protein